MTEGRGKGTLVVGGFPIPGNKNKGGGRGSGNKRGVASVGEGKEGGSDVVPARGRAGTVAEDSHESGGSRL